MRATLFPGSPSASDRTAGRQGPGQGCPVRTLQSVLWISPLGLPGPYKKYAAGRRGSPYPALPPSVFPLRAVRSAAWPEGSPVSSAGFSLSLLPPPLHA